MLKNKVFFTAVLIFLGAGSILGDDANFYFADNGVTVLCPKAAVGESGRAVVHGTLYTKIGGKNDIAEIDEGNVSGGLDVPAAQACTSGVTDMSEWFQGNDNFNAAIGHWDTSSVKDMSWMFQGAAAFNQDIGDWNTSRVTDMSWMFYEADAFNQAIGRWDASGVVNMSGMFANEHVFNQDIGSWNVSKVENMNYMFYDATVFDQDLSSWRAIHIFSEPDDFATYSGFADKPWLFPKWGVSLAPVYYLLGL